MAICGPYNCGAQLLKHKDRVEISPDGYKTIGNYKVQQSEPCHRHIILKSNRWINKEVRRRKMIAQDKIRVENITADQVVGRKKNV